MHHVDESLVGFLETLVEAQVDLAGDLIQALVDFDGEPLTRIGEIPAEAVALLREPFVQVLQHLAVLLLEHRAEHSAGIPEIPLEQYQTAQHAEEDDQRDDSNRESDLNHGSF